MNLEFAAIHYRAVRDRIRSEDSARDYNSHNPLRAGG